MEKVKERVYWTINNHYVKKEALRKAFKCNIQIMKDAEGMEEREKWIKGTELVVQKKE